jgi:hypothetical protein
MVGHALDMKKARRGEPWDTRREHGKNGYHVRAAQARAKVKGNCVRTRDKLTHSLFLVLGLPLL